MSDSSSFRSNQQPDDSAFGLGAPTGELSKATEDDRPHQESLLPARFKNAAPHHISNGRRTRSDWKGFEQEKRFEPEVDFGQKGVDKDEMDMTPMVDVVFLLLIFFMVTASFTMQKSIQQPPLTTDDPSHNVISEPKDEGEYVEIIIDQYNTYRLTSPDEDEVEAASDQEMRVRLRDMVVTHNANKVTITAHGEASNDKVVTAWDASNDNDVQEIVVRLSEADF